MSKILLIILFIGSAFFSLFSYGNDLEIIIWPYRSSKQLSVVKDSIQPFYVMVYDRKGVISGNCDVEVDVPNGWQVWQGSNPPPSLDDKQNIVKFPLQIRKNKSNNGDYRAYRSSGALLLVIRPLTNAASGACMKFKWLKDGHVLAKNEVSLGLLSLPCKIQYPENSKPLIGLWVNNPKFHPLTMNELYRSFHRAGINHVVIDVPIFEKDSAILKELGIKVFLSQWWPYRAYVPGKVPHEAVSTLKNGKQDINRWSPTYMAEGGKEFLRQVNSVVEQLKTYDGIYGFMLDYEPGVEGIDADYSEASKTAFEKYLGKKVGNWPKSVLPGGEFEEAWIDFRCSQSVAYVNWFSKIMKQQTPNIELAVSTSGATGRKDDPNRRLAVVDIDEISTVCDSIHPQLYSWTSALPGPQIRRFNDKLDLGNTTIERTGKPVYVTIGSGSSGSVSQADPQYLRMQVLNWWFKGKSFAGVNVWQYFYGVDGRYMVMLNELGSLFLEAGEMPDKIAHPNEILQAKADAKLQTLCRKSCDGKKAWIGFFNFSSKPIAVNPAGKSGWETTLKMSKVAPWSVLLVKYVAQSDKN